MAPLLAVTDTHALIWAATGTTRRLGRRARRMFERAERGEAAIYVPTIVLVEVAEAAHAGKISLSLPFTDWMRALLAAGPYIAQDLTVPIVERAAELVAIPERGDRLVAATAAVLDCPLITRDPEIVAAVAAVEQLW